MSRQRAEAQSQVIRNNQIWNPHGPAQKSRLSVCLPWQMPYSLLLGMSGSHFPFLLLGCYGRNEEQYRHSVCEMLFMVGGTDRMRMSMWTEA